MLVPYPPLEAYRRDVARLGGRRSFGPDDGRWLAGAVLLQRFVDADPTSRSGLATALARYLASEEELTFWRAGFDVANQIEEAGALHLCYTWLYSLERIVPDDRALEAGRLRAVRARLARKLGALDLSLDLYSEVEQLGESRAEPELTARAWIGFGVSALERGNYPEAKRWYQAAALVADDTELAEQSSASHQGLFIVHAMAKDFDAAVVEGWRAFDFARNDRPRQAEILANMSQALYEMGHYKTALRGFAAVFSRTRHARVLLPALGGVAMAAAALDLRSVVGAAAQRVDALLGIGWPHPEALSLLDLSDAYWRLGDQSSADAYRSRGLAIAKAYALHQLEHRATEDRPAQPEKATLVALGSAASEVVGNIEALDAPSDLWPVH